MANAVNISPEFQINGRRHVVRAWEFEDELWVQIWEWNSTAKEFKANREKMDMFRSTPTDIQDAGGPVAYLKTVFDRVNQAVKALHEPGEDDAPDGIDFGGTNNDTFRAVIEAGQTRVSVSRDSEGAPQFTVDAGKS